MPPKLTLPCTSPENSLPGRSTNALTPPSTSATPRLTSTLPSASKYPLVWKMSLALAMSSPWIAPVPPTSMIVGLPFAPKVIENVPSTLIA